MRRPWDNPEPFPPAWLVIAATLAVIGFVVWTAYRVGGGA